MTYSSESVRGARKVDMKRAQRGLTLNDCFKITDVDRVNGNENGGRLNYVRASCYFYSRVIAVCRLQAPASRSVGILYETTSDKDE